PVRWIYMDGRGHADPDAIPPSYQGDSVARWEGDTLVIDTNNLETNHHQMEDGIPISDKFHIVERIKLAKDGKSFTDEFTMTDPTYWEGEWKNTKTFFPVTATSGQTGVDVLESVCTPDVNDHYPAQDPKFHVEGSGAQP